MDEPSFSRKQCRMAFSPKATVTRRHILLDAPSTWFALWADPCEWEGPRTPPTFLALVPKPVSDLRKDRDALASSHLGLRIQVGWP